MALVIKTTQRHLFDRQQGHTLMEIIAALAIIAILASSALPKYVDLGTSSRKKVLESAVAKLNQSLLAAWYKSVLEKGKGDFQYFNPTLGENTIITNQKPGKQPTDGLIFVEGASEKYQLFWIRPNGNPGRFVLGARVE